MSIIYETLSRLENESTGQAGHFDRDGVIGLAGKPTRSPARLRATVVLLGLTGIGLALWHPNSPLSRFNQLSLADAVASERYDRQPSTVITEEQGSHRVQPAIPDNEAATIEVQSLPAVAQISVEAAVQNDSQPTQEDKSRYGAQTDNETPKMADAEAVKAEVAAAKSDPAPAVSGKLPAQAHQVSIQTQPSEQSTAVASAGLEKSEVPAAKSSAAPAVSDKLHTQTQKVSIQTQSSEQTAAVAGAKIGMVDAPSAKPKPKLKPNLAVPHKQQPKTQAVSVGDAAEPKQVDTVIEQAAYALSRGRYQQALVALEQLSPAPEDRADYWLIKGNAHLRLGQLDPTEKALASAQMLAPTNPQIAVQRAILKQEKGDHVTALKILKDAGERNPDVPEIFLNQGYSEQALGAVSNARRSFAVFLRLTEGRSLYTGQRKLVNEWLAQFPSTSY